MAVGDTLARWDSRLDWAGEWPADGAVLLQRFEALNEPSGSTRTMPDAADPEATWTIRNYANTAALSAGRWGNNLRCNTSAPATEQTSLTVPHFAGLWPSGGKLLFKVWAALSYAMSFTPIISTRNTSGKTPLVYLSTLSDGRPRAMVYNAAGAAVLDQSETLPWTPTAGEWVCFLWLVDMDARTSQLAVVKRDTGASFVGPVRNLSGTPNAACTADFEALTLTPTAAYWAGGFVDEIGYWQPTSADMASLVAQVRRALPARGHDSSDGTNLTVTDDGVEATGAATLYTGAQPVTWVYRPAVEVEPAALASVPLARLSTDDGATWGAATAPGALPLDFDGLVRWQVPLFADETVTAIAVKEQAPPPELDPITDITLGQNGTSSIEVTGTWTGTPVFTVTAPEPVTITLDGTTLTVVSGWAIGDYTVALTVTDDSGLASEPAVFVVHVTPPGYEPAPNPVYARAPLIVHNDAGERDVVIADPTLARILHEVNGEQYLKLALPAGHPKASALVVERAVEAAGELYRIRRITSYRDGRVPMIEVYAEARFYDLGTAGQVPATEWAGAQAGTEMAAVLADTGWTVGVVNVSTVRTWSMQEGSPLACLRAIAQVHGGDLTFDNTNRTVSLLTFSGKDSGLTFFYGRGVSGARRIEDTTTLVTRIIPRNAEGVGIEAINDGVPWLEDYTFTAEVKTAVYDFASGTNPYTMLAMAQAALGKRARPAYSYEVDVIDLSVWSGQALDRFSAGDQVTVVDAELGIDVANRIVRLEYDMVRPWASAITLSETLRELGSSDTAQDAAVLTTGASIDTRDLVPFNLLLNARFDNGLAHWAAAGATVAAGGVTGGNHVEFAGGGTRWVEQTVAPDTRDVYTVSMQLATAGYPTGVAPTVEVIAEIVYDDASTETIVQQVT